ncbi:MAG: nicotinate phosphoribosyltransferase [Chlamydiae bacterium]|nr:nicotinate phosphoribosyltransferase [Chlamydiota bacterium]
MIYKSSLALLTDFYELTMAYGYWKEKIDQKEAVFHLNFRKKPFQGSFAIAAGLGSLIEHLKNFKFSSTDLKYLASIRTQNNTPFFEKKFLDYLKNLRFSCDIDAVEEGNVVFPYEPLIRVKGPLLQAQILESIILNIINFQTLIATKAARICFAAKPDPVVEFGIRRSQGIDGGISASRAAFIGGCSATSNVLAAKLFNIPLSGTQAHSWVMAFEKEEESFLAFAKAIPEKCVLLIDTYESLQGVKKAIEVAKSLKKENFKLFGVRLDSGDLAQLSIEIRKILDTAGFEKTQIIASNELDEYLIRDLKHQKAAITLWGVGTNLVTAKDQSALDGVYKLSAIKEKNKWIPKIKVSEQVAKISIPGILQVRRFFDKGKYIADSIFDELSQNGKEIINIQDRTHLKILKTAEHRDLLVPIFRKGKLVYKSPKLEDVRQKCGMELDKFSLAIRRFLNPHPYFVGLEKSLYKKREMLIEKMRKNY